MKNGQSATRDVVRAVEFPELEQRDRREQRQQHVELGAPSQVGDVPGIAHMAHRAQGVAPRDQARRGPAIADGSITGRKDLYDRRADGVNERFERLADIRQGLGIRARLLHR